MLTCASHCKTRRFVNLAKVDLLHFSHALKRRGLFENGERL